MNKFERQALTEHSAAMMGWHKGYASSVPDYPEQWLDADNKPTEFTVNRKARGDIIWDPLSDLNLLFMRLVPRMQELGYYFTLIYGILGYPGKLAYQASFEDLDKISAATSQPIKFWARDPDLAVAILKALMTMKVK
jgi:hypothetical protein